MTHAMAFGAEPRPRHFQHVFGIAAVGVVTAQAIFPYRGMFEKERSPLFGMALVASVVDRVFLQHRFGGAAVRIVAVRAGHLAFAQRHVGRAEDLRATILVALEAGFHLNHGLQRGLARYLPHHGMTFATGDASRFMRAAVPVSAVAALVATEADRVVLLDPARRVALAERYDAARTASVRGPGEVYHGRIGSQGSVPRAERLFGGKARIVACDVPDGSLVK